jgi:DnaJ-class molecular chaperone
MPTRDLYAVLGVSKSASDKEIRQAYRRLAREHHPDVNPDNKASESRFREISEAYEVLSDKQKRAHYDRFGHVGNGRPGNASSADFSDFFSTSNGFGAAPGMENLIDQLLQGMGRKRPGAGGSRRGQTIEQSIEISLAEAIQGTTRRIQMAQSGEPSKTLEVTIRPGVDTGTRIRMAGQGHSGSGGAAAGDLILTVRIVSDVRFQRNGDDLSTIVDVPFYRAALGGEVEVPTPMGGRLALSIPAGSRGGQRFRLTGQGMPRLGGSGRGDLFAEIRLTVPDQLTDRERMLISELASLRGEPVK